VSRVSTTLPAGPTSEPGDRDDSRQRAATHRRPPRRDPGPGARENNLADISLDIPKRRLTVFTGVSGSGKSSLVFGTIAAESRRLINETYTAFLQSFMPTLAGPTWTPCTT
jgi:hypothetical protein